MRALTRMTALMLLMLPLFGMAAAQTAMPPYPVEVPSYQPQNPVHLRHPAWSRNAVIYQVNTRQFTPEGTFRAAEKQLPRLKALGVDIVWLMPVHPIGVKNRKGTLGSPYSVKDYRGVNPEFGTPAELRRFIDSAHALGMKVILDWVANHTAWDHPWVSQHPDWYARDWKGDFQPTPWWDWHDIINLDYRSPTSAWTASAPTWPDSCRWISGPPRAAKWRRSNRCSCWPNGKPATCITTPST
jgi:1,4-alpha-glucan branching enzyme